MHNGCDESLHSHYTRDSGAIGELANSCHVCTVASTTNIHTHRTIRAICHYTVCYYIILKSCVIASHDLWPHNIPVILVPQLPFLPLSQVFGRVLEH